MREVMFRFYASVLLAKKIEDQKQVKIFQLSNLQGGIQRL